jgi:hypothetical protein
MIHQQARSAVPEKPIRIPGSMPHSVNIHSKAHNVGCDSMFSVCRLQCLMWPCTCFRMLDAEVIKAACDAVHTIDELQNDVEV